MNEREILQVRNRSRFIPSRIFDSSVWRGIPSLAAAPDGPDTGPRLSANAASINSFSLSVEVARREIAEMKVAVGRFSQVSSTENVGSSHNTTARSITF